MKSMTSNEPRATNNGTGPRARFCFRALLALATCAIVFLVLARAPRAQSSGTGSVVITGATLIDGTGSAPVRNAMIVIENGRITRAGAAGGFTPPAGARTVDAAGRFIVPGLIDTHVHYRDWLGEMFLAHGVTSVFDLGNPSDWIFALRDAIARKTLRGPRLYVSGNIVDGQSQEARASMGGRAASTGRDRANRTVVDSVEAARTATTDLIARGADFIKVYQELTIDQLRGVSEEAHRAGLVVFGHTYHAEEAAAAGLDIVTHLWGIASSCMSPEVLARFHDGTVASPYPHLGGPRRADVVRTLAGRRTYVNPLLINEHAGVNPHSAEFHAEVSRLMGRPELRYVPDDPKLGLVMMFTKVRNYATRYGVFPPIVLLPDDVQQEFRAGYLRSREFVREYVAAGGRILAGTDTAGASMTPGLSLHHELKLLVDAGLTPMQAIETATRIAGELVSKRDKVGTLQVGSRADLVIVSADPLADIGNLQRIEAVYKDGEQMDTRYHAEYSSPIPYPITEFSSSYVPAPSLATIAPMSVAAGAGPVTLAVRGSGFSMTSVVTAAGRPLVTRFIEPSRVEATLTRDLLERVGTLPIAVVSPRPGGGTSNAYGFVVAPPPSAGPGVSSSARPSGPLPQP
jgi:imidazolonepropionase-like amidohydrolase